MQRGRALTGKYMKYVMIILGLVTILTVGVAIAENNKTIQPYHAEIGLTCKDCHGTDEPTKRPAVSVCTGCHGEYESVAELTADLPVNPHDSHQGPVRCYTCHKSHETPVLYCNECHSYDMTIK